MAVITDVITTVLAAAVSHNLTDLTTIKAELSISASVSDDVWLGLAIKQVSSAIERHCKRVFVPEQVQDWFDVQQGTNRHRSPGGLSALQLSRWPVMAVQSVVQTAGLNAVQTLANGIDFRLDAETGRLLRLNSDSGAVTIWEPMPVTVIYTAGYGANVAESRSVPGTSAYTVTVTQAAAFSCDEVVSYASGAALTRVSGAPTQGQYRVAAGVYTFAAADASAAMTFNYATVTIPDDLVEICLRLMTARFQARGRDPTLIQQDTPGIGTQRWWFNGSHQGSQFSPEIEDALDSYRVPTAA